MLVAVAGHHRVHHACEHQIMPDQYAMFVQSLIKLAVLELATDSDSQHVKSGE